MKSANFLTSKDFVGANLNLGISGAAFSGQEWIVRFLVDKGAKVNEGITNSASPGHESIVRFLADHGARSREECLWGWF